MLHLFAFAGAILGGDFEFRSKIFIFGVDEIFLVEIFCSSYFTVNDASTAYVKYTSQHPNSLSTVYFKILIFKLKQKKKLILDMFSVVSTGIVYNAQQNGQQEVCKKFKMCFVSYKKYICFTFINVYLFNLTNCCYILCTQNFIAFRIT